MYSQGDLSSNDTAIYTTVDQAPSFPGGNEAMMKFIQQEIKFTEAQKKNNVSGTCFVTFIVEKDGSIGRAKILRGVKANSELDIEVCSCHL